MAKREFMQLGEVWEPAATLIGGWWMSHKMDGMRAFYDGGITRGLPAKDVPWANTTKDDRLLDEVFCTGLWSRYGKVIRCPEWFLRGWPNFPLDLELWAGNGQFQTVVSITKRHDSQRWSEIKAMMLDAPSWWQVSEDGEIKAPAAHWDLLVSRVTMLHWLKWRGADVNPTCLQPYEAFSILKKIKAETLGYVEQVKLPANEKEARAAVETTMDEVVAEGGEGLILRHPQKPWFPKRVSSVLKVKPRNDAEGTAVGFCWGKRTDKGSRHLGRMGSLILDFNGKRLELSGFTDEERAIRRTDGRLDFPVTTEERVPLEAAEREGKDASADWEPVHFPKGTRVTFKYRELSRDGLPKEAAFDRKRED